MRMIDAEFLEQEISKWINCPGDGEYYCGYDNALTAVLDLIADAPTLTPPNEWVSVEKRLPEDEKAVLAYYGFNRGDGYLGMMFQGVLTYFSCDANPHWQHEGTGLTVTHWMPLPAPPEGDA